MDKKTKLWEQAKEFLKQAWEADKDNRYEAAKDLQFLAGDQWPEAVRAAREKSRRPMLTINRLPQFINQVVNDIRQADLAIDAIPSADEDKQIADIYNGIMRQIQYQSSAQSIYASAAFHQVGCGMGVWRIKTRYIDDASFDQEIYLELIDNPLSVYFDPAAREVDRSDADWCLVTQDIPRPTFTEMYPKEEVQEIEIPTDYTSSNLYWFTSDTVRIAEVWKRKVIYKKLYTLPDGGVAYEDDLTDIDPMILKQLQFREVKTYEVRMWIVSGNNILEGGEEGFLWPGKYIPIIPAVGQEIPLEKYKYRYGLTRFARDAQQLYNFYRSSAAEWINLAPKAPYLVTKDMIGKHKSQWDDMNNSPRPYLVYDHDDRVPGGPKREAPPILPTALLQEAQFAVEDMKATTGIFDASLGAHSNERSGKAILARQKEGDVANFHFTDNLQRALEYCGRQLIDLIPKIYDSERVVRIVGKNGDEQVVPINKEIMSEDGIPIRYNDISVGRFDVKVKIGPAYSTKRQEAAEKMIEFMQAYPAAGPLIGDLLAKNLDFPGADQMAERLKTMLPPNLQGSPDEPPPPPPPPPPELVLQQQIEEMKAQAQQAAAANDIEREKIEAQKLQLQIELERVRHQNKMMELNAQGEISEQKAQNEVVRMSNKTNYEASRMDGEDRRTADEDAD